MIYVECRPDVILVKSLTKLSRKEILHVGGKAELCRRLEKQRGCKGVVDEDPLSTQPPYIRKLKMRSLLEWKLKALDDDERANCLIVLCPRLEEWTLEAAKKARIEVEKFGLPNDPLGLHEQINLGLSKFEALIKELKDTDMLKALKRLLEE